MKSLFNLLKNYKVTSNKKPYKTVTLSTGLICEHYANGTIQIK